ncbi:MFS transporter [Bacillus salitolerans]|uniref:MFS transporter n=1 Tax=Bacillus salitolerans TaxID=1437434 RepID=A0ABW4LRM3_9BACI
MLKDIKQLEKPLIILLIGVLLSHLGTYMVLPMLPIILTTDTNLTVIQIGTILASIAIAFQFGSIIGGILADRIGRRFVIGLGALVGGIGIFGFGIFSSYSLFLISAITMGIGNGLNAPSTKAAIAALASGETQTTAFSFRGIAANIGTASAGLIIFFLIAESSKFIFWIAGIIYILLTIKSWTLLPKNCGDGPCPILPVGAYKEVFKNRPFIIFSFVSILIWALYAQLSFALPLRATEVLSEPKNVALIWTLNSFIVITSQGLITRKVISRVHPLTALSAGVTFIGFGVGSLYFSHSFIYLAVSGFIFVIGEMLILPTIDSMISQLSKAELIGVFFALANVVSGLGEAGGKSIGGGLLSNGVNNALPWIIFSITGVLLSIIILLLKKWEPLNTSLKKAAVKNDRPIQAPHVTIETSHTRTHPYNNWEQEVFFRHRPKTE